MYIQHLVIYCSYIRACACVCALTDIIATQYGYVIQLHIYVIYMYIHMYLNCIAFRHENMNYFKYSNICYVANTHAVNVKLTLHSVCLKG